VFSFFYFLRNPQADLQAQDRAHRIGQKRPVQVFRLVTDDSVEVKVVERAQQKLKLDAMVVQQGRLQEKEKKMSKQDLLDTLRFGADKIFRSKESSITDADIDLILEEGRKRTEELNEKLQVAEKGDMYDFRLDGGMATQMFEGKDYSDKLLREQEKEAWMNQGNETMIVRPYPILILFCLPLSGPVSISTHVSGYLFLDPGKRERKAIVSYSETVPRPAREAEEKAKLPRHLRLSKMEEWQFFNKMRLYELQNMEIALFDEMAERGEVPQPGAIGSSVFSFSLLC
jgi:SWI/SNF-related matrix-associated actin-dependent regulator of chromatin subfamily A member 5